MYDKTTISFNLKNQKEGKKSIVYQGIIHGGMEMYIGISEPVVEQQEYIMLLRLTFEKQQ